MPESQMDYQKGSLKSTEKTTKIKCLCDGTSAAFSTDL